MIAMFGEFHMWFTFLVIIVAMALYVSERLPMEVTSLVIIIALLLVFSIDPPLNDQGAAIITPLELLSGFSNPALITIVALLIMAQGLFQSGAL